MSFGRDFWEGESTGASGKKELCIIRAQLSIFAMMVVPSGGVVGGGDLTREDLVFHLGLMQLSCGILG